MTGRDGFQTHPCLCLLLCDWLIYRCFNWETLVTNRHKPYENNTVMVRKNSPKNNQTGSPALLRQLKILMTIKGRMPASSAMIRLYFWTFDS